MRDMESLVSSYAGGQVELHDPIGQLPDHDTIMEAIHSNNMDELREYLSRPPLIRRGEVASVSIRDRKLYLTFSWLGRKEFLPAEEARWVPTDDLHLEISLDGCCESKQIGRGSFYLRWPYEGKWIIFFSQEDNRFNIDPNQLVVE